jgi:ribose 5-phosphate isomerase A
MDLDKFKVQAAERALDFVKPGMKLGLGTGSTAAKFVDLLGARVREGLEVVCVATSETTFLQAEKAGITLSTLDEYPQLDLTVDGADELDRSLKLIKGGGGALLREKIVAMASDQMVVIADYTKQVDTLGAYPLPVEVVQFGMRATLRMIEDAAADAGCVGTLDIRHNKSGELFLTDGGNLIVDCAFGAIDDPETLSDVLEMIPGVVEHGLFIDITDIAIIAGPQGVHLFDASGG